MTTEQIADPFEAGQAVDDEEFASPVSSFLKIEDLDGRLVIVFPETIGTLTSRTNGKDYDRIVADVVIVDGPATEKIPQVPFLAPAMHLSADGVVNKLRSYVGKNVPVLGRIDSRPSKFNSKILAYGMTEATEQDKIVATPARRKYRAGGFE